MENFFWNEYFCSDIEDFLRHADLEEDEDIKALPSDACWTVEMTTLELVIKIDDRDFNRIVGDIVDGKIERLPEDCDDVCASIEKAFKESIDLVKLNELMPKLYYPNGTKEKITKQDLLDYIN